MPVGMFKDIEKPDVQSILDTMYVRQIIDGYLQPFYSDYYKRHKELIAICHQIEKFRGEEPEYHEGDLEIAYRQLKELFEVDENFTQLEDFEEVSMTYRRSTK